MEEADFQAMAFQGLTREAVWVAPFLSLGLLALGLFRPLPHVPPPVSSRTVVDANGTAVRIALPFRGIVLTPTWFPGAYLEDTGSPGLLVYVGNIGLRKLVSQGVPSWIYPQIMNPKLWNDRLFRATSSPYTEIESVIASDASVYMGCGGPPDFVRRVGLPVFNCGESRAWVRRMLSSRVSCGSPPNLRRAYYPESYLFPTLRTYAALIENPDFAKSRVDAFCEAMDRLQAELQPSKLTNRPRAFAPGEEQGSLDRAGLINAEGKRTNRDDPEELLAMDPDIIFLVQGTPQEFDRDRRWQGLKAVQNRRVYRRPGIPEWWATGITFKPVETRWLAELAHPDLLRPETRELLRNRVLRAFGYALSEEQIDIQLHVAENAGTTGAERFTRNYRAPEPPGASQ